MATKHIGSCLFFLSLIGCATGTTLSVTSTPDEEIFDFTKRLVADMNRYEKSGKGVKKIEAKLPDGVRYNVIEAGIRTSRQFEADSEVIGALGQNYKEYCVNRYNGAARAALGSRLIGSTVSTVVSCFDKDDSETMIFQAALSPDYAMNRRNVQQRRDWVLTIGEVPKPTPLPRSDLDFIIDAMMERHTRKL